MDYVLTNLAEFAINLAKWLGLAFVIIVFLMAWKNRKDRHS